MSPPLISKAAARYTGAGGKEHCSLCRHFSPRRGGRCARVLGDISPMGWCRLFSREMRGLVADASSFNGGGGPALGLDFMTPGVLDPRITFTRASTGTYFNSAGVMQTAATNTPRWDYDPATLQLRGMLIEEARTNAVSISSADFTVAGYTKSGCAVTRPVGTNAPDGSALNLVTENTATSAHSFYGGAVTVTAATWTVSVFVRAGTQRYISLRGEQVAASSWPWITFDTQTQTINANANVLSSGFVAIGGGTYRIWLSWAGSVVGGSMVVAGCNTAAAPVVSSAVGTSYAGTSQTWYAWGLQAEAGAFATSYIPTTSVAVTREVDVCGMPAANTGWFVSPGGSWFAEFISISPLVATSFRRIVTINAAASVAPITLDNTASKLGQFGGGSLFTTNAITVGAVAKGATAWTTGAATCCLNGGTVASSAGLTGFAAIATNGLRLLTNLTPAEGMNGYIRRVQYWSRILTPAELQTVTTP